MEFQRSDKAQELIATAIDWLKDRRRVALLTLVNIEGNAPYPIGSQMLVDELGQYNGQITGGCAERALADQAVLAINALDDQVERYGLGSKYFDIQLPCGSGIDVHFDVTTKLSEYQRIQDQLSRRQAVLKNISFEQRRVEKRYYPNQRLIIVGQGPIFDGLPELARLIGFDVLSSEIIDASEVARHCDQFTGLISLFHEHDREIDILHACLSTELFYIGALGSRRTHSARREKLLALGVPTQLIDRINGPIGIDINAITPYQIAISILGEVIDVMNKSRLL